MIPSIRKHGVYMTDSLLDQVMEHPEIVLTMAQTLVDEGAKREELDKRLQMAQPKADYFDAFVHTHDGICLRDCGKEIGISQNTFIAFMLEHHYLYRHREDGHLLPYAGYCVNDSGGKGYFTLWDFYLPNGQLKQQTLMTCKGKEHFRKLIFGKRGEK